MFWITKSVLLAGTYTDKVKLDFPVYATPKIDGIRAVKNETKMVSRTFKEIRNVKLNELLSKILPPGADGEIIAQNASFQETSSLVMSVKKDLIPFTYYWFDYCKDPESVNKSYLERMNDISMYLKANQELVSSNGNIVTVIPLFPVEINSLEELHRFEKESLDLQFEGIMIRRPTGHYKMGRGSPNDQILLKIKQFCDSEAIIIGTLELYSNQNEKNVDGKRSTCKDGLVPMNTLGSIQVKKLSDPSVIFNIGSGFNDLQRDTFWKTKENLLGKIVKYQYFEMGSKISPRFPTFLGFRDPIDIV
jgi:DNA ligase 1